jgi:hypothetical protein
VTGDWSAVVIWLVLVVGVIMGIAAGLLSTLGMAGDACGCRRYPRVPSYLEATTHAQPAAQRRAITTASGGVRAQALPCWPSL